MSTNVTRSAHPPPPVKSPPTHPQGAEGNRLDSQTYVRLNLALLTWQVLLDGAKCGPGGGGGAKEERETVLICSALGAVDPPQTYIPQTFVGRHTCVLPCVDECHHDGARSCGTHLLPTFPTHSPYIHHTCPGCHTGQLPRPAGRHYEPGSVDRQAGAGAAHHRDMCLGAQGGWASGEFYTACTACTACQDHHRLQDYS